MKEKYLHGTVCPMCHDREQTRFVWSDMLHMHICWHCAVELCVDFYPSPDNRSNYFLRASEMLGYDEWICRRLYLQEVLMHRPADADTELCKRQMEYINDFLALVNKSRETGEIEAAKIILLHKLKDKAFRCHFEELVIDS